MIFISCEKIFSFLLLFSVPPTPGDRFNSDEGKQHDRAEKWIKKGVNKENACGELEGVTWTDGQMGISRKFCEIFGIGSENKLCDFWNSF